MGRRNNRPALYELSRPRPDASNVSNVVDGRHQSDDPAVSSPHWLTPGVGIRIPGGFLVLGGLLLIGSIIG